MSENLGLEELSEVEAAIVLLTATVVAYGAVHTSENDELIHQVKLIVGNLGFNPCRRHWPPYAGRSTQAVSPV